MTPIQVKRKAATIRKHIEKWNQSLISMQETCTHINATHVNKADTGNWCKSDDNYWTEHRCPDCGKFWLTDQDWDKK